MTPEPDEYERYKALVLIDRMLRERRPEQEIVREVESLRENTVERLCDSAPDELAA